MPWSYYRHPNPSFKGRSARSGEGRRGALCFVPQSVSSGCGRGSLSGEAVVIRAKRGCQAEIVLFLRRLCMWEHLDLIMPAARTSQLSARAHTHAHKSAFLLARLCMKPQVTDKMALLEEFEARFQRQYK
eukprot:1140840-Pelagomonas_calceolata.AAC.8